MIKEEYSLIGKKLFECDTPDEFSASHRENEALWSEKFDRMQPPKKCAQMSILNKYNDDAHIKSNPDDWQMVVSFLSWYYEALNGYKNKFPELYNVSVSRRCECGGYYESQWKPNHYQRLAGLVQYGFKFVDHVCDECNDRKKLKDYVIIFPYQKGI